MFSLRFALTMSLALKIDACSIDFTIACPQVKLKNVVYIKIPWGYEVKDEDHSRAHCLKPLTNWCGLKDGGPN